MKTVIVPALVAVMVLSGCAGRKPDPVTEVQPGDATLSCAELRNEINANTKAIQGLVEEKNQKTAQNLVAGTTGAFLLVPLFFMDLKGAAGDEARAFQRRNEGLAARYNAKGCQPEIRLQKIEDNAETEAVAED